MPVVQDSVFDILPAPTYNFKPTRKAPKVTFESTNGYVHQRERYSHARRSYDVEFIVNQAQCNTLENWLDQIGSDTFWFLPPEALWKDAVSPTIRLMRIPTENISPIPLRSGAGGVDPLYRVSFQMVEV